MEALWNVHVGTGMPPGLIHDQSDLLLRARANGMCKLLQCQIHRLDVDSGQDQPLSAPRLRMHEAVEIHPFIPLLDVDRGTRSFAHPDAPQKRFEANTMFVHGPQFDGGLGMLCLDLLHILAQFSLNASWACGSAFTMARTQHPFAEMEAAQILPAQLGMDRVPRLLSDPDGHLGS